jgi:hypothetical protein
MAKDLFIETKFLPAGDFTQPNIIENDILLGKKLPTATSIFKSDKKQRVFLELWNETDKPVNVFVKVSNNILQNALMSVCEEVFYAHTLHQIEVEEGDEIFASAEKENSVSYNIVL